jgi:hypothetical protein
MVDSRQFITSVGLVDRGAAGEEQSQGWLIIEKQEVDSSSSLLLLSSQ